LSVAKTLESDAVSDSEPRSSREVPSDGRNLVVGRDALSVPFPSLFGGLMDTVVPAVGVLSLITLLCRAHRLAHPESRRPGHLGRAGPSADDDETHGRTTDERLLQLLHRPTLICLPVDTVAVACFDGPLAELQASESRRPS